MVTEHKVIGDMEGMALLIREEEVVVQDTLDHKAVKVDLE